MTDRRVLAGGPVLAAEMVTEGSVMWPAVAMVVVGLALAIAGLAILTGRGQDPSDPPARTGPSRPDAARPIFTARSGEPVPVRASQSTPLPASVRASQSTAPVPVRTTGVAEPDETTTIRRDERTTDDVHHGPCDWELHVDLAEGDPVVVRQATARACCVHVLRVRSLDAVVAPSEREDRTWSGDRTRIGPSRAVSDVRTESRRVRPEARGLGLSIDAVLERQDGRPVVTSVENVDSRQLGYTAAEQLWESHLAALEASGVVSDPEERPLRLPTATRYRTEVVLRTSRGCSSGGHHLDTTARVRVDLDGEVTPAVGTRLTLPHVGGWVEGDLHVAATEPTEVLPGTEVHPAPRIDGAPGLLSVSAPPGAGEIRGSFAGTGDERLVDRGVELLVASAVVADVGLGEARGHPAARARVRVEVDHRISLVVSPHAADVGADELDRADLECSCTPAYEVQFGGGAEGAAPHSHAMIHVEGRDFRLEADARPGTHQVPSWTVTSGTGHDEAPRGIQG